MKGNWNPWRYIKNYKFNSLFLKNFFLILLVILVPIWIFCSCIFIYFQSSYKKELNGATYDDLNTIKEIIDTVELNIQTLSTNLATESLIQEIVQRESDEHFTYEEAMKFRELMENTNLMSNQYIQSIYIYSNHSEYVVNSENTMKSNIFYDMSWKKTLEENTSYGGMYSWGRIREQKSFDEEGNRKVVPCITTGISVPVVKNDEIDGYIVMNMDNRWIERLVDKNNNYNQDFMIIDESGNILYNEKVDRIGKNIEYVYENLEFTKNRGSQREHLYLIDNEQEEYFVNRVDSTSTGWTYMYITDMRICNEKVAGLFLIICIAIVILTVASVLVAYFISIKVFLPLKQIIEIIDDPLEFYEMNTKETSQKAIHNELKYIIVSFMNNVTKQERNREELTDYITKLKETQVSLLQTQINPHFLFNTFQTINFMAIRITKSDNQVSDAIGKLSSMLRNMMEVDQNLISIDQEIQYSKNYIELEQLRYQDEFRVSWKIDESILNYLTLKISLQPLLENSIRHGFKKKKEDEKISVEGMKVDNKIYLTVQDNGEGVDEEWMEEMNKELNSFQVIVGKHIGIRNVNQRIKLLFGTDYGIQIDKSEVGFCIRIIIPAIL